MKKETRIAKAANDEDSCPHVVLPGSLVGRLPARLTRELQSLSGARVFIDATRVEHVDTPAVEALRAILANVVGARVLLSARPGPVSHLLRTGLLDVAQFDLESGRIEGERRRHHRYATRLELRIALADGQVLSGVTENISCGGLRAQIRASRTDVHGAPVALPRWGEDPISIDLIELGLQKWSARVIAQDVDRTRIAFVEPCENLFAHV